MKIKPKQKTGDGEGIHKDWNKDFTQVVYFVVTLNKCEGLFFIPNLP